MRDGEAAEVAVRPSEAHHAGVPDHHLAPGPVEALVEHAGQAVVDEVGGQPTFVIMHNDAVVQGLSEAPFMRDVERWGVMTIGTGLGNARFTNREAPKAAD